MPQKKEQIKSIRTSLLTRGWALARASLKGGGLTASRWLNPEGAQRSGWLTRIEFLIQELGQLKGTAMKVGQALSIYGEHLLPPEVNEILKNLQQNSVSVEWSSIYEVLLNELGQARLEELEIDSMPIAAASIGQVHRARIKSSGESLAIKIQYPGIETAVKTDLKLLKFMLQMSELVPRGPRFDQIFSEIQDMFYQEIDYRRELEFAEKFYQLLNGDPRYVVPKVYRKYSSRRVLTLQFMDGVRADSSMVQELSQQRRNQLGLNYLQLYLRELLDFKLMQTDPHLGNYMIQIDADPAIAQDRLVLLDFGAVRSVPDEFLRAYVLLIEGGLKRDERLVEKGGRDLKLLASDDSMDLVRDYINLCFDLIEPFADTEYDWGTSDLAKRVALRISRLAVLYKLRAPPKELVFLDRKLAGVFIFVSILKCRINAREHLFTAVEAFKRASHS